MKDNMNIVFLSHLDKVKYGWRNVERYSLHRLIGKEIIVNWFAGIKSQANYLNEH